MNGYLDDEVQIEDVGQYYEEDAGNEVESNDEIINNKLMLQDNMDKSDGPSEYSTESEEESVEDSISYERSDTRIYNNGENNDDESPYEKQMDDQAKDTEADGPTDKNYDNQKLGYTTNQYGVRRSNR